MKKNWKRALDNFFDAMATKLEENKHKGGWKYNKNDWYLHKKLLEEVAEYFISLDAASWSDMSLAQEFMSAIMEARCRYIDSQFTSKTLKKKVNPRVKQKRELADVGNIAMMLFDNT